MTPQEFIHKWQQVTLTERSACQQHFLDLCELLGQPKPAAADPEGAWYTFERGAGKSDGGQGWADVWMRGHFGWEYKGKHKDLAKAYDQLLRYREALENPPLLVVCDMDRFEVHTNFTGTAKKVHAFSLENLDDPVHLEILRKLFTDPQSLKPGETTAGVTEKAAKNFGVLADGMRVRGIDPHRAAHFLMKLMFCMFAEDIGLLGRREDKLFTRTLANAKQDPKKLASVLKSLFDAMSTGGMFGADEILYFNGGLFQDADVVELTGAEIRILLEVNGYDWAEVEPSIFGTLFERTLDPAKRSQIGAHYTSREDIETLLRPVMLAPLLREWEAARAECDKLFEKFKEEAAKARKKGTESLATRKKATDSPARKKLTAAIREFQDRLCQVTVLDPACGSGNFLYVALHLLLDLEKQVISYAGSTGIGLFPLVRPTQLRGIEINPYAQELAQVVIWIGYLQWMHHNGFAAPSNPVLDPIDTIENKDAILDLSDPEHPKEPDWPSAEFIVGNPPFLGYSKLRASLGHPYVETLFKFFGERLSNQSDICCYWFEKANRQIAAGNTLRAGLLGTQAIRGGKNRGVLDRIATDGEIFFAESDREWVLDGANVHVAMVGFHHNLEPRKSVDGQVVESINSNLTSQTDVNCARSLPSNKSISFIGGFKFGPFEIADEEAVALFRAACVNDRPTSDVLRPWLNGADVSGFFRRMWIIDFGVGASLKVASRYDPVMEIVSERVKPVRDTMRRTTRRERWWLHGETAPALRARITGGARFVVSPRVAKHRLFVFVDAITMADGQLVVFASEDASFFGILHSRIHETWTRSQGTQVRERESGFRYTPTTCFETFPFPPGLEPGALALSQSVRDTGTGQLSAVREAIAVAARELDTLRNNWLNPPDWTTTQVLEFPGTVGGPWDRYIDPQTARSLSSDPSVRIGTVKYPRLVPNSAEAAKHLKKRTLTNLYNERPTWLDLAHKKLDEAVFAAYGWDPGLSDEELLAKLLELNLERAAAQ